MDKHTSTDSPRDSLTAKLEELGRRAGAAKEMLTPGKLFQNPWVRVGLGVAVGIAIGSRLGRSNKATSHESILHAVVRASLAAAAAMMVRNAFPDAKSVSEALGVRS